MSSSKGKRKYMPLTKGKKWILLLVALPLVLFFVSGLFVPEDLFRSNYSTVLESSDGRLLGARIAGDEQWRFPASDSVPLNYELCVLEFEDRFFYRHPGINILSLGRAVLQNLKAGKTVSGGSTITMQLCRLARGQKKRNIRNKLIEMLWALHVEWRYSKKEILNLYASHAPFGGNIVGIEAASWRYFGRESTQLSWAEAATLAVLPNAPALIYPGQHDRQLLEKRNRLLKSILHRGSIDSLTYELALAESIPEKVKALPGLAYHLTQKALVEYNGKKIKTTLDYDLQLQINEIVRSHHSKNRWNSIHNMAILVAEIPSKKVRAYVANVAPQDSLAHAGSVDIIQAKRSTGSILKPFLYCKMLDEGSLTPKKLIPDIPVRLGGFTPMNFDREYSGAVPADEALARSLNIPAIYMLREYGVAPFHAFLKKAGMSSLTQDPEHYGLSLILGGAEVSLWDLTGMYASFGTILKEYEDKDGFYSAAPFSELAWVQPGTTPKAEAEALQPFVRASSIFATFDALLKVSRPESEAGWEKFASAKKIAWKTGTSFGFRDAWAVGVSSNYVVGVWVGNADGEGRPGLTGISAAAPVLFDVFTILPSTEWFSEPVDECMETELCAHSGYRPGEFCEKRIKSRMPEGNKVGLCPWHRKIHLNHERTHRVNANCYRVADMQHENRFVLPPAMEYFYKKKNVYYSTLPPLLPGCMENDTQMEFIYPREWNRLFIPVDLDGTPGKLIYELAHRSTQAQVYWYLNDEFMGITRGKHQIEVRPEKGWHRITVTDNLGNTLSKRFFVVNG